MFWLSCPQPVASTGTRTTANFTSAHAAYMPSSTPPHTLPTYPHTPPLIQARLLPLLADCLATCASPNAALRAAFLCLEAEYRKSWEADAAARAAGGRAGGVFPGCTALAALLLGRQLYVANAGDCRGVIDRGGARGAAALSRDHTAALESERARVAGAGGDVSMQHGSWRLGGVGLQVSRCIGDFDQK